MCLCGQLLKMQAYTYKRTDPKILRVKVMQALQIQTTISIYIHSNICVYVCVLVVTPTLQKHAHTHTVTCVLC